MKRIANIIFWTSLITLILHLLLSFVGRTIVATPFLSISLYGLVFSSLSLIVFRILKKIVSNPKFHRRASLSLIIFLALITFIAIRKDFELRYGQKGEPYQSYTEMNGNLFYTSGYRFHNIWKSKYNYRPNKALGSKIDKKVEFEFEYTYNNLGFRNDGYDIDLSNTNDYRILALGDSWTEGIGTPDGKTWTASLQAKLSRIMTNARVINVGKSGSDPIYSFYALSQLYNDIKPQKIILTLNTSDINDVLSRGGVERFKKNGKVQLKTGPWWEFFYAGSFLTRKYIRDKLDYSRLLIPNDKMNIAFEETGDQLLNAMEQFQLFGAKHNLEVMIVFVPEYWDMEAISKNELTYEWEMLVDLWNEIEGFPNLKTIYLPDCYLIKIKDDPWNYWWKYDYHHTPKGYELMSECIFEQFIE